MYLEYKGERSFNRQHGSDHPVIKRDGCAVGPRTLPFPLVHQPIPHVLHPHLQLGTGARAGAGAGARCGGVVAARGGAFERLFKLGLKVPLSSSQTLSVALGVR